MNNTKQKKLFIHIPKCGGMTIRHSDYLRGRIILGSRENHISKQYSSNVLKTMNQSGDHHGFEHARWRDIAVGVRAKYQAFAICRNPWDRVVSRYFFAKKVIEVEKKESPSYADVSSFEAFLEERHKWGNQKYYWHRAVRGWFPTWDHVSDTAGQNLACDMLRLEHLNQDVCAYFKIKEMSRPRNVTGLNKLTYMDMYTPQTLQIVADWYKKDIDFWGFDFDTGATRNYWAADKKDIN